jgi:glutamate-1-semialdehyde 2,1-aminomutase
MSFGAPTERELRLAQKIVELVPGIEKVRLVNSGTEATMSAVRLARAATGRDRIIKFAGCYHGHADPFLVRAGSGATTLGTPTSPGVPRKAVQHTLVASYNDLSSCERLCENYRDQIAAIVVEPLAGNMGVVPPAKGFLPGLRQPCDRHGILLVFDEVISGFRVGPGGAQEAWAVRPDLTCLGKVIGGGLPVGAYGGRKDLMDFVSPAGPVYQAGTLSGNPLAMAAGLWSLARLTRPLYRRLARLGAMLAAGLADAARDSGVALQVNAVGSLLTPFFTDGAVCDYTSALRANSLQYGTFFRAMLARGIYTPPSQFEAWFLSAAHSEAAVARTIKAAREAMREVAETA